MNVAGLITCDVSKTARNLTIEPSNLFEAMRETAKTDQAGSSSHRERYIVPNSEVALFMDVRSAAALHEGTP